MAPQCLQASEGFNAAIRNVLKSANVPVSFLLPSNLLPGLEQPPPLSLPQHLAVLLLCWKLGRVVTIGSLVALSRLHDGYPSDMFAIPDVVG